MSRVVARLAGTERAHPYDGLSRPPLTEGVADAVPRAALGPDAEAGDHPTGRSASRASSLPLVRKVLAVGGAAVFLATFYLRVASRAGVAGRMLIGVVFGGFLLVAAALGSTSPPRADAHLPPSFDVASVSGSISPIQTGWGISQPIVVHFSAPMAAASVQAALRLSPQADVRLEWDATGSQLYVEPVVGWTPGTVYSVSVGPGAQSTDGAALAPMAPAIVYVRPPATATLAPTHAVGDRLGLDSGFRLQFSRPVDLAGLRDAFTITPSVDGTFAFEGSTGAMPDVIWVPSGTLAANTTYTVSLAASAVDLEGAPLADLPSITVRTIERPAVVRFRPRDKQDSIDPAQLLSVRFTVAMERASTRAAYHLYSLDKGGNRSEVDLSKAKTSWAEGDTVLVIDPPKPLVNGTTYLAEVASSARSTLGATLADDPDVVASATFTVVPKASAPAPAAPAAVATPPPTSSGGGTTSAPWLDVEKYYLTILNCTHTGGWLHSDGTCTGYGSNGNPALILDPTLSTCASRPWAKYLATTDQLYHGDVGGRFSACGYHVYWGENLTSWTGSDMFYGAIHSVLFFQSEKGQVEDGHYLNLISSRFTHAGIGVWRYNGRSVYTIDFWGPY